MMVALCLGEGGGGIHITLCSDERGTLPCVSANAPHPL